MNTLNNSVYSQVSLEKNLQLRRNSKKIDDITSFRSAVAATKKPVWTKSGQFSALGN